MSAPSVSSPELTHRRILAIALPIVLSNITVPLLGAVDTGVVGQLGVPEPIGAVGIAAVIIASVYWIFGFLRMGTSGMVAQSHGAGDHTGASAHLGRALLIGGLAGMACIVLQGPLIHAAFQIAPASAEVEALAKDYLRIRIWGAPASISLYAITGWLIATERTRGVFALQILMNGLNVVLDIWFVLGLGWGVEGVAVATLIAEVSGLILGLWLARHALADLRLVSAAQFWAADQLRRIAAVNGDIMVRSVLLQGAFTTFVFLGAKNGDVDLAANQVLIQFMEVTAFGLDGFAFAAEALVGQAIGARRPGALIRAARLASVWGLFGAVVLAFIFATGGGAMIDLLTTSPEVREAARSYLPWLVAMPLIGVASWMLDGIFIGATLTSQMRNAMLISVAIYAASLLVLVPAYGNHGLWAGLVVLNLARGITLWRRWPSVVAAAGASS